jgi:amidase
MNLTNCNSGDIVGCMRTRLNTAADLCARIKSGETSSVEALSDYIGRIEEFDGAINAVVVRDFERAMEQAEAADRERSRTGGDGLGPLHGLPLTVKESFNVSGLATTWGMEAHRNNVADEDAEVVRRLRAAGAIVFGKTNIPTGVADQQTSNPLFGTTNNPWDTRLTCGGSSGGSAAALAAGFTDVEVGSDLAGSLRVPAHFCGVYSHRPSYGLVPQTGHSISGNSATTDITAIGPMARSVEDLRLLFDVLAGPDQFDAAAWKLDLPRARGTKLSDFRVAVLADHQACEVDSDITSSILDLAESLRRAGARVDEAAEWPFDLEVCRDDYIVMARVVGLRHSSPEALRRMAENVPAPDEPNTPYRVAGRRAAGLSHHAWHALNERRHRFRLAWQHFFRSYDVVLCPAHASQAFAHDLQSERERRTLQINGRPHDYNASSFWLAIAGLNYLPVTVCPIGIRNRLPVGMQVIGPYLEDNTTLRFAELLEDLCPHPVCSLKRREGDVGASQMTDRDRGIDERLSGDLA